MSRLLDEYNNQIKQDLKSKLGQKYIWSSKDYKNHFEYGCGWSKGRFKTSWSGSWRFNSYLRSKAIKTNAKKAISGFKIRSGMPLGVK